MSPDSDWFTVVYELCRRHRRLLPVAVLLTTGLSVASLWAIRFDTTVEPMLPVGSAAQRMIRLLREASFADKVVISLGLRDAAADPGVLLSAADQLQASLGPPLVTRIITDVSNVDAMGEMEFFFRHAPQVLDATDLAAIEQELAPERVEAALRRTYLQLLKPEGLFLGRFLRRDPLGVRTRALERLRHASQSFGYDVAIDRGHLVSRDGRHAMIALETSVPMTDGRGSRRLLDYLQERIGRLPAAVAADVLCGHNRTLSNERLIKRDIALTNTIGSVVFLALLFVCFRQVQSVLLVFLVPVFAALLAVPLTAALVDGLALLVVGLGSVIAGIAVDYGMHVYVAVRHSPDPREATRQVATPVIFGSLTVVALFVAFFFSTIPGYHQLAWFAVLSVMISIGCAIFVLPQFIQPHPEPEAVHRRLNPHRPRSRRAMSAAAVVWGLTILAGIPLALRVRFSADVSQLDGTDTGVLAAEEAFRRIWSRGEGNQALLVVSGTSLDEVLAVNDRIYREARTMPGADRLTSLAAVWPAAATRRENAARWREFWDAGRVARLRTLLTAKAAAYGFTEDAFDPFFAEIEAGTEVTADASGSVLLSKLQERLVSSRGARVQVTSLLPDDADAVAAFGTIVARYPTAGVISGKAIVSDLSTCFSREILRISAVAVVLVVATTFLLLRNTRAALVALVPPVTAVVWLLAILSGLGTALNVATLIAGVVVFGLSVDYSFVMIHSYRHRLSGVTRFAVHLSAVTTIVGTAVLLFAHHPAIFSMGLTLTIGVTSGYAAAVCVVPAFCELWLQPDSAPPP